MLLFDAQIASERYADVLEATQATAQGTNHHSELLWRKELYAHLKDAYYEAFEWTTVLPSERESSADQGSLVKSMSPGAWYATCSFRPGRP